MRNIAQTHFAKGVDDLGFSLFCCPLVARALSFSSKRARLLSGGKRARQRAIDKRSRLTTKFNHCRAPKKLNLLQLSSYNIQ